MQTELLPGLAKRMRLWPAFVILALQALALVLTVTPSISNFTRFALMMGGPLVCLVLFAVWWWFASGVSRKESLAISLIVPAIWGLFLVVSHASMGVALWIYGVPLAMLLVGVGLTVARNALGARRAQFAVGLAAIGLAGFSLLRLEGFDGAYWPELRWRWTSTKEEQLVRQNAAPVPGSASTAILETSDRDWPGFRGPHRDSRSATSSISTDWNRNPPRELWRISVGPAWSSFAVVGDSVFTQEQRGDSELVACYDVASGGARWSHSESSRFSDVVAGPGPRATPTFAAGRLFALGARASLLCLDASNGDLIWQRDLMTEFGAELPVWGFSGSPLVVDDVVVVYAGGRNDVGWVAFHREDGRQLWSFPGRGMNFSSAQLVEVDGSRMVIVVNENGLHGLNPADGRPLWSLKPSQWQQPPMVQPQLIAPGRIAVAVGDGAGVACVQLDRIGGEGGWQAAEVWLSRHLKPAFNDFVCVGDHLFGFDQNIFACIDAANGKRRAKQGRYGFGQVLALPRQELLLITSEDGYLVLLRADPSNLEELGRKRVFSGKTWNHAAISGRRLFLRNGEEAVCLELPAAANELGAAAAKQPDRAEALN